MLHAWLIVGPPEPERRALGRKRAAALIAAAGQAGADVAMGHHPDVQEYPDPLRIEHVREIMASLARSSLLGGGRVLLLGELGQATREAQNALLRVVEEPPPELSFVAECASSETVLPTLRSRFAIEPMVRRTLADIVARLHADSGDVPNDIVESAAAAGRGYIDPAREALAAVSRIWTELPSDDGSIDWFLRAAEAVDSSDKTWLNGLGGYFTFTWNKTRDERFLRARRLVHEAQTTLSHNGNPRLTAEVLFLELARLGVLQRGASSGSSLS